MTVLFIIPILDCQPVATVGIASLATHLRRSGHQARLLIVNEELGHPLDLDGIHRDVLAYSPDLIGFSSVNSQYEVVIQIADYLRERTDIPSIYGGPCPTVMAEKCIRNASIDYVCVGEGEEALVEFLDRYEEGGDISHIPNIWAKENGSIVQNPVRPLGRLDAFYPLDFSIYEEMERILEFRNGWFDYSLIRGCPYNCAHCQSAYLHALYGRKFRVRYAPIERVVENLEDLLNAYRNIRYFNFNDDTFNVNKRYLVEFCRAYRERIYERHKVTFNVLSRVDLFDEEICRSLKKAGVRIIKFGVESGSRRVRRRVLNRKITDKAILEAFRICGRHGIETWAFNMIGLPTETREELDQTFRLNAELKPDNFWLSIFYPIEKTALYDFCVEKRLIDYDVLMRLRNYRTDSPLVSDRFEEGEIALIYRTAAWILNSYAYPRHRKTFRRLISRAHEMRRRGTPWGEIEQFIDRKNRWVDENLTPPFYSQRFRHIAIKITGDKAA